MKYSDHYETIVALVTYLAACNRYREKDKKYIDNATAWWLVKYLGLAVHPAEIETSDDAEKQRAAEIFDAQVAEVESVLNDYKSLFRKSIKSYDGEDRYRYSLLLRYARRPYREDNKPDVSDPLSNEELFSLLNFISSKAKMEQDEKSQMVTDRNQRIAMFIAALSAIIAAAASVIAALVASSVK